MKIVNLTEKLIRRIRREIIWTKIRHSALINYIQQHQKTLCCILLDQGWGLLSQFSPFRSFPVFHDDQYTSYLHDTTFIFDRCHWISAAETPDKYERDWKYVAYIFAKPKIFVTDKLTNGALVTSTPDPCIIQVWF